MNLESLKSNKEINYFGYVATEDCYAWRLDKNLF